MYIDLNIVYFLLAGLGCIAVIYLIITLGKLNKLLKNVNELLENNKNTINDSMSKLPELINNATQVTEDVKDITDVATDVTANLIVTKENIKSNIELVTEILNILRSVFGK